MCVAMIRVRYKNHTDDNVVECESEGETLAKCQLLDTNEQVVSYTIFKRSEKFERVTEIRKVEEAPWDAEGK